MRRPIPCGYRSRPWGNPLVITSRSTNALRRQRLHPMVSIIRPREFAAFPPQWLRPEDREIYPPRIHLQIGGHRFGTHVPVLARAKGCIRLRGGMMIERVAQEWEF